MHWGWYLSTGFPRVRGALGQTHFAQSSFSALSRLARSTNNFEVAILRSERVSEIMHLSHKGGDSLPSRPRPGGALPYLIVRAIELSVICEDQIAPLSLRNWFEVFFPGTVQCTVYRRNWWDPLPRVREDKRCPLLIEKAKFADK